MIEMQWSVVTLKVDDAHNMDWPWCWTILYFEITLYSVISIAFLPCHGPVASVTQNVFMCVCLRMPPIFQHTSHV